MTGIIRLGSGECPKLGGMHRGLCGHLGPVGRPEERWGWGARHGQSLELADFGQSSCS